MMPENWKAQIGWPDTVPEHVSLWVSLLQFRREYD